MAGKSLRADEICDLLATLEREEEEEMVDDPMEVQVEEDAFIRDAGGDGEVAGPSGVEAPRRPAERDESDASDDEEDEDLSHPIDDPIPPCSSDEESTSPAPPVRRRNMTSTEEMSRKRRRGLLNPAIGTPIGKIEEEKLKARDFTEWHRDSDPALPRISSIRMERGEPSNRVKDSNCTRMSDIISLFLCDEILAMIVLYTNQRLALVRSKLTTQAGHASYRDLCMTELKALIGILIHMGACVEIHTSTKDLFDGLIGYALYRSTMTERRFAVLMRVLRFDDATTRRDRAKTDKFAPMRTIWDKFISNCRQNYEPGQHMTVDEQLVPFRGRCPFKMYIPSKPGK